MNAFSSLQDQNIFGSSSNYIGGAPLGENNLDTTIGLRQDMEVGQINNIFSDIQQISDERRKREVNSSVAASSSTPTTLFSTPKTGETDNNTGNNTIWIIVLIVILIVLVIGFIVYKLYQTKEIRERAKKIYTNVSNKLSSVRSSFKNTDIQSQ